MEWLAKTLGKQERWSEGFAWTIIQAVGKQGVRLVRNGNEVVLATAPKSAEILREIVKIGAWSELNKASLETLAIIIYKGYGRAEVDYIRGVNSSFILRDLLVRGWLKEKPKEAKIKVLSTSRPWLCWSIDVKSLEELPDHAFVSAKLKEFLNAEKKIRPATLT